MKSPTASESASLMKNDYMSLRIQTQPSKKNTEAYSHTLYFGPLKEEHPDLPLDSTVHITNLPLDVSEEQLKCLFGVCGKVTKVIIGKSGTSSMSSLSSINGNMDPISQRIISEQGYIVFASCSSLKRLSKVKSNHWLPEKALPLGELRYQALYESVRGEIKILADLATQVIRAYDTRKREEAELAKQKLMDAEGFTLVTRKHAAKHGSSLNLQKKPKNKKIDNFYQFQRHEAKRNKLKELKQKFDEDKKKLIRQREARKFNPH